MEWGRKGSRLKEIEWLETFSYEETLGAKSSLSCEKWKPSYTA